MEETKVVATEATETTTQETKEPTKTFTQAELDAIVQDRLSRERNKFAKEMGIDDSFSKESYEEFKKYQEARKSEFEKTQERATQLEAEREALLLDKLTLENQVLGMELGIKPESLADAIALANLKEGETMRDKMTKVLDEYPIFSGVLSSNQPKNIGAEKKEAKGAVSQADAWLSKKGLKK
jgi:hypothetical protein